MAPDVSNELIDQTMTVWQPRSAQRLTREDARQIIENIAGFFQILAGWDEVARQATVASSAIGISDEGDMRMHTQDSQDVNV